MHPSSETRIEMILYAAHKHKGKSVSACSKAKTLDSDMSFMNSNEKFANLWYNIDKDYTHMIKKDLVNA